MQRIIVFLFWFLLMASLPIISYGLDKQNFHFWGMASAFALKGVYLSFGAILFIRFWSFNSQKSLEIMAESYARLSGISLPINSQSTFRNNLIFNVSLIFLAIFDFILFLSDKLQAFQGSIWIEFLLWNLIFYWIVRSQWLIAFGLKEQVKEKLDNARSLAMAFETNKQELHTASKRPYALIGFTFFFLSLCCTFFRYFPSEQHFRVNSLKKNMLEIYAQKEAFWIQNGSLPKVELGDGLFDNSQLIFTLQMKPGELYLQACEKADTDFFLNGKMGDQALVLQPDYRFIWKMGENIKRNVL